MYSIDNRAAEIWTALPQQVDAVGERFLLIDVETPPPVLELVRDLDVPHLEIMKDPS